MTISKWVNLIFACAFLVAFLTFNKAFIWIWELAELTDYAILNRNVTLTTVLALASSVGLTFELQMTTFDPVEGVFDVKSGVSTLTVAP